MSLKVFIRNISLISCTLFMCGCVTTLQNLKPTDITVKNESQGVVFGRFDIDVLTYSLQIGNYETDKVYEFGGRPPQSTRKEREDCWYKSENCFVPFCWSLPAGKYSIYNFIDFSNPVVTMTSDPMATFEVKVNTVTYIGTLVGRRVQEKRLLGSVTTGYNFKLLNEQGKEQELQAESCPAIKGQQVVVSPMQFRNVANQKRSLGSTLGQFGLWESTSKEFVPQKEGEASK